ncbi:hypothetical protein SAMN05216207_104712 [Pseudonocardia ammonioxydans]|uniref:Uncharacterized protein n=1 Tax=Pseudonocardia ammonioxydans TaxID=260086 RepID=A0A1I5GIR6_PSUAM|nr:hypothetical protein [Pseudonocardia ammonioxydans]SFO35837.1 hypothetical protein SAMN05216207_104712 [Pseudonocardia ammonioxydans]
MNNVHWAPATGGIRTLGRGEAIEALRPADGLGPDEAVVVIGDNNDIAVHGTKDELRAMLTRLQGQVEQLAPTVDLPGGRVEYFEEGWDEVWGGRFDATCPCGNAACSSGFYFADRDGSAYSFDDPPQGWQGHQTMGCPDCGRFYRQVEHDERGYPVAGCQPVDHRIDIAYARTCMHETEKTQVSAGEG